MPRDAQRCLYGELCTLASHCLREGIGDRSLKYWKAGDFVLSESVKDFPHADYKATNVRKKCQVAHCVTGGSC